MKKYSFTFIKIDLTLQNQFLYKNIKKHSKMNYLKKYGILPLLALFIISCINENDSLIPVPQIGSVEKPVSEVIDMVKNFEKNSLTKAGKEFQENEDIVIDKYEKKTHTLPIAANPLFKTLSSEAPDSASIDIYFVTFHKGEKEGYSIASSDKRINRIYAYTENGHISDTINNIALARIIELIPYIAKQDLQKYYSNETQTKATASTYISYGPYLKTRWIQGPPFNNLLPLCDKAEEWLHGRVPAGCVTIATAQIIAYYKKFNGSYYGNANIDFENLTNPGTIMDASYEPRRMQIATFIKEVGAFCQVKYNCDDKKVSGSSNISSAALYLTDQGYSCRVEKNSNVNLYQLYINLSKKNVHLTGGNQKTDGNPGHAWVWDGIRGNLSGTTLTNVLLHCNWGNSTREGTSEDWSNGWFASYEQPVPNEPPFLDNNQQCYITNYK